ncbi:MAG: cysteine desulfurase NifS [Spirochaetales bacterium]|nr:cysteine desulfurase NifS [Spirochaetales bacterium]
MKARSVYLDNNATTRVAPEVLEEMLPFLKERYGNPSSMYTFGGDVHRDLDTARERVAALLHCQPTEVVFTSCGSESDNHAVRGLIDAYPEKGHIITTKVEHPAIKNQVPYLRRKGLQVTELGVDSKGNLDLEELREAITNDTLLISAIFANNETGIMFPIREICRIAKERGVFVHTDAVQGVGKVPLDMEKLPVDLLSFSGHKFHAPKGIGGLFIRRGLKIRPFIIGGHQERSRRGGTESIPLIVGMGKATELVGSKLEDENTRVRALRDRLEKGILSRIPDTEVNGDPDNRVPNTTNIGIHFIEGEALLLAMDKHGICASTGSACASGSLQPSHVLRAMGVPFTSVHGSVRFSLSTYNTEEDVDYVLEVLPGIVEQLRELSPFHSMADVEAFGA